MGSKNFCCVVGCTNSYNKCPPGTKFYHFPRKTDIRFPGRREQWKQAVRRQRSKHDKQPWSPTKHSQICSQHFVGGQKSDNPTHPAYNPTIFPHQYRRKRDPESALARHERLRRRLEFPKVSPTTSTASEDQSTATSSSSEDYRQWEEGSGNTNDFQNFTASVYATSCDQGVQANITEGGLGDFTFTCDYFGDSKSTMACIPLAVSTGTQTSVSKLTRDVAAGPNIPLDETSKEESSYFKGYTSVKCEEEMIALCGVRRGLFLHLLEAVKILKPRKLSFENKLMMFLMKLKHGLPFVAVAVLYGVHRTTASVVFKEILQILICKFSSTIFWPSKFANDATMPVEFQQKFPDCRAIIDCTEITIEKPPTVEQQVFFYSNYKKKFTAKFLVGITPAGFICFVSKAYGGRSTDSNITVDSGFLDYVEPGDLILSDKGFPQIQTKLREKCVELLMPPFATEGKPQFTVDEMETCYKIASVRIHVERVIGQIKRFRILKEVSQSLLPDIDDVFRICCVLTNMSSPIVN